MKDLVTILIFFSLLVFVIGCRDPDVELSKEDFVKFKLNGKERIYDFEDSVYRSCEPTLRDRNLFLFQSYKTYPSSDSEFLSITISIRKDSSVICPKTKLDDKTKFDFVLTCKANDANRLVDFTNNSLFIDHYSWSQANIDNKIVVSGEIRGWLYQEYFYRPESPWPIEPMRFDSLFIESAQFQFTIN